MIIDNNLNSFSHTNILLQLFQGNVGGAVAPGNHKHRWVLAIHLSQVHSSVQLLYVIMASRVKLDVLSLTNGLRGLIVEELCLMHQHPNLCGMRNKLDFVVCLSVCLK